MDSTPSGSPSRRPGEALGIILVLVSAAGFGSGALFVQPLYDAGMEPTVVLYWRFLTAAVMSWGFVLASRSTRSQARSLSRRRIGVLLLLGTLYVGNSYTYYAALEVVPVSLSSIITYVYPAIVAVLATRFVRRLEGRRAWVALALSMLGVALALGGIPEGAVPPFWGLALAAASPLIYAVWIVLQARLAGDRPIRRRGSRRAEPTALEIPPGDAEAATGVPDPAPAAAFMTTGTALVYALIVAGSGRSVSPLDVPATAWLPLLGIGLLATAVAIQAFYAGVRRVGGARAALISTVEPVYTITLAMLLLGERLTGIQIVGGALVIAAVILAETGRRDDEGRPVEVVPDRVGPVRASADHDIGEAQPIQAAKQG